MKSKISDKERARNFLIEVRALRKKLYNIEEPYVNKIKELELKNSRLENKLNKIKIKNVKKQKLLSKIKLNILNNLNSIN